MSNELYLIAHKVRGEPAFDIAVRMKCPECAFGRDDADAEPECVECDGEGYWWIIPTSGHRAYPWWSTGLIDTLKLAYDEQFIIRGQSGLKYSGEPYIADMPADLPDHYPHASRHEPKRDLLAALGLTPKPSAPSAPFPRRI